MFEIIKKGWKAKVNWNLIPIFDYNFRHSAIIANHATVVIRKNTIKGFFFLNEFTISLKYIKQRSKSWAKWSYISFYWLVFWPFVGPLVFNSIIKVFFYIFLMTVYTRLGNRATLEPLRKFIEYCRTVELLPFISYTQSSN